MCGDFEYELVWNLKCSRCGKKPAIDLRESDTGKPVGEYKALCEKCGIPEGYCVMSIKQVKEDAN